MDVGKNITIDFSEYYSPFCYSILPECQFMLNRLESIQTDGFIDAHYTINGDKENMDRHVKIQNSLISSAPSDASSSQEAKCWSVESQRQETPALSAASEDANDDTFSLLMKLDLGEVRKDFDYGELQDFDFGDMEHVEEQEVIPSTFSGPRARNQKRKHWKPKKAPCTHCLGFRNQCKTA